MLVSIKVPHISNDIFTANLSSFSLWILRRKYGDRAVIKPIDHRIHYIPPNRTLAGMMVTRGISREDLACKLRKPVSFVQNILDGEKEISFCLALRLAFILKTNLGYFYSK